MATLTSERIWDILEEIKDPEIPVVSVVEMGLIRSVGLEGKKIIVVMTPTFAGCPALDVIQREIDRHIRSAGAQDVEVKMTYSPPWSSNWILPEGRRKLKEFGLAPPPRHKDDIQSALLEEVTCPYCDSRQTTLKNSFGPTLCRAIYYCNNCHQPFEQFKPL
ncbi:MAG: phenylacetate-CoA oxygenase subunit PaaJ [Anaerolineales bacterium]|jgi:ring-1,2-phenylacetyl-CoA epoxidase subunit PaaD